MKKPATLSVYILLTWPAPWTLARQQFDVTKNAPHATFRLYVAALKSKRLRKNLGSLSLSALETVLFCAVHGSRVDAKDQVLRGTLDLKVFQEVGGP